MGGTFALSGLGGDSRDLKPSWPDVRTASPTLWQWLEKPRKVSRAERICLIYHLELLSHSSSTEKPIPSDTYAPHFLKLHTSLEVFFWEAAVTNYWGDRKGCLFTRPRQRISDRPQQGCPPSAVCWTSEFLVNKGLFKEQERLNGCCSTKSLCEHGQVHENQTPGCTLPDLQIAPKAKCVSLDSCAPVSYGLFSWPLPSKSDC